MLVIRHSFIGDYFVHLWVFVYLLFSLEIKIFPHGIPMDVFFWFSLNLNILNLQAVESREISTLMDYMDRTRQTGILHLSHLKEGNTQLTCSLPTWTFGNPAHSSRIDIHSAFRAAGFCMPSFLPRICFKSLTSFWCCSPLICSDYEIHNITHVQDLNRSQSLSAFICPLSWENQRDSSWERWARAPCSGFPSFFPPGLNDE